MWAKLDENSIKKGLLVGNGYIDRPLVSKLIQPVYFYSCLTPDQLRLTKPLLDHFNRNLVFNSGHAARLTEIRVKPQCNGKVCYLHDTLAGHRELLERHTGATSRKYSKQHGRPEENNRKRQTDSDSDSDSDTECKGLDRSEFWRRKMRTFHNILDVDKDGLISCNDLALLTERFKSLGHLDEKHAKEFTEIIKITWEEQWGALDSSHMVTIEQYIENMDHVLNDKTLKKKAHLWLPYLFRAVDQDASGFLTMNEFRLLYECLGLDTDHAAVGFAVIDINGDEKLSMNEFVKLGRDFLFTEDETRISKMFWGPLNK